MPDISPNIRKLFKGLDNRNENVLIAIDLGDCLIICLRLGWTHDTKLDFMAVSFKPWKHGSHLLCSHPGGLIRTVPASLFSCPQ